MDALMILLKLLCSLVLLTRANTSCTSAKCTLLSPEIRSPFRIQGLHPHQCGLPGFTLFCTHNQTAIHFPGNRHLFVKTISYETRTLSLVDPKSCVHEVFLNLNLSLTPFTYYYALHNYKYINCSAQVVGLEQVPCLSASNHHVYVVDPSVSLPVSCTSVKTVAIPFSYNPYLSDTTFGLGFTWHHQPPTESPYSYTKKVLYGVLSIIGLVFVVLLYACVSKYETKFNEEKAEEMLREVETDKLLGEYEGIE